jgi:sporulation protein YlmC with PRC-barrel domain
VESVIKHFGSVQMNVLRSHNKTVEACSINQIIHLPFKTTFYYIKIQYNNILSIHNSIIVLIQEKVERKFFPGA